MRIVDAVWEKRNLELDTKEIMIEDDDSCDDIRKGLLDIHSEYVVVKIPTMRMDLNILMAELGYVYAETMMDIVQDITKLPESSEYDGVAERMSIVPMGDESFQRMIRLVRKGIFHTDRIATDPYFSKAIANRRYAYWMQDARERGVSFFEVRKDGEPIGFYGADQDHYIFLSGLYPEFQGNGLGNCLTRKMSLHYREHGIPAFRGKVSSNNLVSLKRCLKNGYKVERFTYIYIKHNLAQEEYFERLRAKGVLQEMEGAII